jgi:hypothetical protein
MLKFTDMAKKETNPVKFERYADQNGQAYLCV